MYRDAMKQFALVSLAVGLGLTPVAQPQSESAVTREGRYWVRTVSGSISAPGVERLRLETVGNVVLRGDARDHAVFTLKARVRARDERDAAALLGQFDIKTRTQGAWG